MQPPGCSRSLSMRLVLLCPRGKSKIQQMTSWLSLADTSVLLCFRDSPRLPSFVCDPAAPHFRLPGPLNPCLAHQHFTFALGYPLGSRPFTLPTLAFQWNLCYTDFQHHQEFWAKTLLITSYPLALTGLSVTCDSSPAPAPEEGDSLIPASRGNLSNPVSE